MTMNKFERETQANKITIAQKLWASGHYVEALSFLVFGQPIKDQSSVDTDRKEVDNKL